MKTKLHLLFIVLALFAGVHQIAAQGTAFTYQGRLNDASGAANGTYDLTFKLWTLSSGGSQVGSTLTFSGVGVTNGLFTETLDFLGVFNGSPYWLELGVRTNGAASFTTLIPRQELTPTPYAITAENVDGLVPAAQLSGTLPSTVLSGTYSDPLDLNNPGNIIDGSFVGSGTGLTGVALLAGGNTFSGNQIIDGMLKISDGGGVGSHTDVIIGPGGYYPGEEHSINFDDSSSPIGSLILGYNGTDGYFSVGNLYHDTYQSGTKLFTVFGSGSVGIGTTNPAALLDVESTTNNAIQGATASTVGSAYAVYGVVSSTSPGSFSTGVRGQNNGTGGSGIGVWGSQNGGGWGGYFTSASGIGVLVSGGSGTGISVSGATGISVNSSGSALTIGSGAIHVSGANTNSSTAAFTQVTTAGNIAGNYSIINNPLCNGDPNAILLVTHNDNPGGVFYGEWSHAVGVFYSGSAWWIYNEDNTTMPAGLAFNVLIIKN